MVIRLRSLVPFLEWFCAVSMNWNDERNVLSPEELKRLVHLFVNMVLLPSFQGKLISIGLVKSQVSCYFSVVCDNDSRSFCGCNSFLCSLDKVNCRLTVNHEFIVFSSELIKHWSFSASVLAFCDRVFVFRWSGGSCATWCHRPSPLQCQ